MEMEHKQAAEDEASPSDWGSAVEDLPASSSQSFTGNEYWTAVEPFSASDSTTESECESFVHVLPGRKVKTYHREQIILQEQIAEGGQGIIYKAALLEPVAGTFTGTTQDFEESPEPYVAKLFKGKKFGQWPENVFGLHLSSEFICDFEGYCIDGDMFYLIMKHYDCSLRDLLDKQMKNRKGKGPPLPQVQTLLLIINIALGLQFSHEKNVLHRDLKADNILVDVDVEEGVPNCTVIADFDVASSVKGTLFWRAPEILQALKELKTPVFTPKADVYSYAMTCYEILTGSIPLKELRYSDYDAVLSGKRPKLPPALHPKVKDLLCRCWHQDPNVRPTFKGIVSELKELHRELITGNEHISKFIDGIFDYEQFYSESVEAGPESNLIALRKLFEELLVKYNEADFLLVGWELVTAMEQFQSQFGLRSFKQQPSLPYSEWQKRRMLFLEINWKYDVLLELKAEIFEWWKIYRMIRVITSTISEDIKLDAIAKSAPIEEMTETTPPWDASLGRFLQGRTLPAKAHANCWEKRSRSGGDVCDLCIWPIQRLPPPDSPIKLNLYENRNLREWRIC